MKLHHELNDSTRCCSTAAEDRWAWPTRVALNPELNVFHVTKNRNVRKTSSAVEHEDVTVSGRS